MCISRTVPVLMQPIMSCLEKVEVAETLLHILDLNNEETEVFNPWINDFPMFSCQATEPNGRHSSSVHVKVLSSTPLHRFELTEGISAMHFIFAKLIWASEIMYDFL